MFKLYLKLIFKNNSNNKINGFKIIIKYSRDLKFIIIKIKIEDFHGI